MLVFLFLFSLLLDGFSESVFCWGGGFSGLGVLLLIFVCIGFVVLWFVTY